MTDKSKEGHSNSAQRQRRTGLPRPSPVNETKPIFRYNALVNCVKLNCPRSIRLLELLPGLPDADIETQLIETTLTYHRSHEAWSEPRETRPWTGFRDFAALSYEWGAPEVSESRILVNGQSFYIRSNLWKFLSQIRQIRQDELPMLLWVDSICINQQDVEEKNVQVRMMHKIYTHAKEVLVWLGDGADLSSELFRHLPQHYALIEADERTYGSKQSHAARTGSVRAIMRNTAKHSSRQSTVAKRVFADRTELMVAVLNLCRRTYWTRAWIIQQCLSAKAVALFCGEESLPHEAFPLLGTLCKQLKDDVSLQRAVLAFNASNSDQVGLTGQDADPSDRVVELTNRWHIGRHNGLESLLRSYHGSACSVLHDKVYAFLGLSSDGTEFPIDYNVSLHTLLAQTITFCNSSKHRFNTSKIDPIRATCDSIQIAQLVAEDLRISDTFNNDDGLQQILHTVPEEILNQSVTIELDYLGPIRSLTRQSGDNNEAIAKVCISFRVHMRNYKSLPPLRPSYGDRVFALRGTPLVLVYRRTITRLHFIGYAILQSSLESTINEDTPLLTSENVLRENDSSINEVEAACDISSHIEFFLFPSLDPIPRYHLQHSQFFEMRFFRKFILPYLSIGLQKFFTTQTPDSVFFASPFMHVRLELVLRIVSIWPKRTRRYEDYCKDLRASDRSKLWNPLGEIWHYSLDIGVRVRNSINSKWRLNIV